MDTIKTIFFLNALYNVYGNLSFPLINRRGFRYTSEEPKYPDDEILEYIFLGVLYDFFFFLSLSSHVQGKTTLSIYGFPHSGPFDCLEYLFGVPLIHVSLKYGRVRVVCIEITIMAFTSPFSFVFFFIL